MREFRLFRGDSWTLTLVVTDPDGEPVDFDDAIVACQARRTYDAADAVDLFTEVDGNMITVGLSAEQTAEMLGSWVFDVEASGVEVRTLLSGRLDVDPDVTR